MRLKKEDWNVLVLHDGTLSIRLGFTQFRVRLWFTTDLFFIYLFIYLASPIITQTTTCTDAHNSFCSTPKRKRRKTVSSFVA